MVEFWRPLVLTFVSIVTAPLPAAFDAPCESKPPPAAASEGAAIAPPSSDADLFVEPDLIVLPTYVSGDVARLRLTVQSRRDAPVEIEEIGIRDVRFTVRVPGGFSGEGIDRVACEPPLRVEPRGSIALEFGAKTRGAGNSPRVGLFRRTIVAKVRGNPEPIHLADVSARIVLGYSLTPAQIDFGDVLRGETRSLAAVIETDELGPIRILSIRLPPSLPFTAAAPPEAQSKRSRRIVLTVKLDPSAAVGEYYGSFELETDSPQRVNPSLGVHARIRPNLEVRLGDRLVQADLHPFLNLGMLHRGAEPVEIVVRDTRPNPDWQPGDATLTVLHQDGDASLDPKFEVETTSGATAAERRIRIRLLEAGSRLANRGELHLPLHHPDLDELVLRWSAILRDR